MKSNTIVLIVILLLVSLFSTACQLDDDINKQTNITKENDTSIYETVTDHSTSTIHQTINQEIDDKSVYKQEKNYTIYYMENEINKYRVDIYDNEGVIIKSVSTRIEPNILITSYEGSEVIGVLLYEGTGISTRLAVFCNLNSGECSEDFIYFLDFFEDKIIIGKTDRIIVRDIFDSKKFNLEFSDFSEEIGQNLLDAVNASFSDDGREIIVNYRINEHESETKVYNLYDYS